MCGVTPCMVSIATKHGISLIYHSMALLISTTGVVRGQGSAYVIVVPWAQVICLICIPKLEGLALKLGCTCQANHGGT